VKGKKLCDEKFNIFPSSAAVEVTLCASDSTQYCTLSSIRFFLPFQLLDQMYKKIFKNLELSRFKNLELSEENLHQIQFNTSQ
jgi:hypothetical protein